MKTVLKPVYFLLFSLSFFSCQQREKKSLNVFTQDNVGQQFVLTDIVDTSGQQVTLDFSKSEITIIDFWNNGCPPCIADMKQFPDLIKGRESKVSIFSISLAQYWLWKPTIDEHEGIFSFLKYDVPNWKQFNLVTKDDPRSKNSISIDRWTELEERYKMNTNPAYFVVDKTGKIIARPGSAVLYMQENL